MEKYGKTPTNQGFAMQALARSPLVRHFSSLEDPRIDRQKKHMLIDIVVIAVCATLCGYNSFEGFEEFGESREDWLKTFLRLPNGIPSHDTFTRVFARINPSKFQQCFLAWIDDVVEICAGEVIAIDGKALRHSFDTASSKSAIHMVSAFATANGMTLAQTKVSEKSNELTAIPNLLDALRIKGCVVTIDAIGCQKNICEEIIKKGGDYCIAVKGNQKNLKDDIEAFFSAFPLTCSAGSPYDIHSQTDRGHGRVTKRTCFTSGELNELEFARQWPGVQSICLIKSVRTVRGKTSHEERYYVSSLASDAKKLANAVRLHWCIENQLHWSLDVTMGEDACRARKDYSAENLAVIRRMALNLQKKDPAKKSVPKKQMRCALNPEYLAKTLTGQHV